MKTLPEMYLCTRKIPLNFVSRMRLNHKDSKTGTFNSTTASPHCLLFICLPLRERHPLAAVACSGLELFIADNVASKLFPKLSMNSHPTINKYM